MSKKKKWVVYPDVEPMLDELKEYIMQENEKLNVDELDIEIGQEIGEMTDNEQREVYVNQLKKMRMRFNPIKHSGNKTINSFGTDYKQKRKKKNKQAGASRKANRKK